MTMSAANLAFAIKAIDDASKVFHTVADSAGKMGDSIVSHSDKASAALDGVAVAAGAVAAITGAALVAGLAAAVNTSSELQQAQNDLAAKLGLTADAAAEAGQTVREVYGNNFGASIEEVGAAVAVVTQQLQNLPTEQLDASLATITENAFRLKDTFGLEVGESISAVRTLMENFGLTSEQAFNFITSGMQRGLDRSGDFLDTIGEYSTQFANGGADAGQFFSLLESGLQGGALGTDKAADAFKEFRVRIQDGSKLTAESLAALGLNAADIGKQMASGQMTAADAFQLVTERLAQTKDSTVQFQAGVGLLGTQFEDLGQSGVLSLSMVGTAIGDLNGATSGLDVQYDNLGSVFEGFKRRAMLAITPVGDAILALANGDPAKAWDIISDFAETTADAIQQGLDRAVAWVGDNGPRFAEQLLTWGRELVAWVGPQIGPMMAEFNRLRGEAFDWIVAQIPGWIDQLGKWAVELTAWIGPQIPVFLGKFLEFVTAGLNFIGEKGPVLAQKFLEEWVPAAIKWVAQAALNLLQELPAIIKTVWDWATGPGGTAMANAALNLGKAIVTGIINGLGGLVSALASALFEKVKQALMDAGNWLGIGGGGKVKAQSVNSNRLAYQYAVNPLTAAMGLDTDRNNDAGVLAALPALLANQAAAMDLANTQFANFTKAMQDAGDAFTVTDAGRAALGAAGFDVYAAINAYQVAVNQATGRYQVPPAFATWLASMLESAGQIPGAANGMANWRGGPLWVGERGPELLHLPRGADVIPAGRSAALAGGMVVNVYVGGSVYDEADFEQRVAEAFTRTVRRGGFAGV